MTRLWSEVRSFFMDAWPPGKWVAGLLTVCLWSASPTLGAAQIKPGCGVGTQQTFQAAHPTEYAGESIEETTLREVFGNRFIESLEHLPSERYSEAREQAVELAFEVKDHEICVTTARASLLTALVRMEYGKPLLGLPDPSFEVVGVMPVGESPAGREAPGALSPQQILANRVVASEAESFPVSALKKNVSQQTENVCHCP